MTQNWLDGNGQELLSGHLKLDFLECRISLLPYPETGMGLGRLELCSISLAPAAFCRNN